MMTAAEVLNTLQALGATLRLGDAGQLRVNAPKGIITPDLQAAIKSHKTELLAVIAYDACERAWEIGDVAEAEKWALGFEAWASGVTFILPGDTPLGLPTGRWKRFDKCIEARFTRSELAWALAIAGNDSDIVRQAIADTENGGHEQTARGSAEQVTKMSQPMQLFTSHKSVEYYTPSMYVEAAREVMGGIDLDPASCPEAQVSIRASQFYIAQDDGLTRPWFGRVWLNPPYSTNASGSNQSAWSKKLVGEYLAGNVKEAILLVKSALGYKWFEELFARWPVCFARERIAFIKPDGTTDGPAKHGTAFFYFGPNLGKFKTVFSQFGRVILPESQM